MANQEQANVQNESTTTDHDDDDNITSMLGDIRLPPNELNVRPEDQLPDSTVPDYDPEPSTPDNSITEDRDGVQKQYNCKNSREQQNKTPFKPSPDCKLHIKGQSLKYKETEGENLVDLTTYIAYEKKDYSPVYLRKDDFDIINVKPLCNVNRMVELLMEAIFTTEALQECSLGGNPAVAFKNEESEIRKGLDSNARNAIIDYVIDKYEWKDKKTVIKLKRHEIIQKIKEKMNDVLKKWRKIKNKGAVHSST